MNDYIYKSTSVLNNINDCFDDFRDEARVIEYAKCIFINGEELKSFNIDGIEVYVYGDKDTYYLDYNDVELKLQVKDNLIYDYNRE